MRTGAARTGSSVRACFSPMIENVAIESGMYAGISRKKARNCWTVNAPASSLCVNADHSGRWARIWLAKSAGNARSPTSPATPIGATVQDHRRDEDRGHQQAIADDLGPLPAKDGDEDRAAHQAASSCSGRTPMTSK